jgi:hypothetical protein
MNDLVLALIVSIVLSEIIVFALPSLLRRVLNHHERKACRES